MLESRRDRAICQCRQLRIVLSVVWGSKKISNGKRKGSGNTKNGNKYLAWAFVEAANFAVRCQPKIRSFYQRKKAKT